MPHVHVDYSPNLTERLNLPALLAVIRNTMAVSGVFPVAGIRIRATAADHVLIADGDPGHAFLDISIRLRGGRPIEARQAAVAQVFDAVEAFCAPVLASSSFLLSLELREIDPGLSRNSSSIRRYLPEGLH
jgi:5-carboxymethyl-2-hydroxymuconate isomerase